MTGIVRGFEVKTNRDSEQKVLMLQVEISGPGDVQSVEAMTFAGMQIVPPENSIVTVVKAGNAWKIAPSQNDGIDFDSSLDEGESKIYSSDGGVEKAFIKLLKTGIIELNGNNDFAVRFSDLKSGFDTLKSDFNTFLVHVHGASGTPPVPPAVPSTASIDSSKVSEVKII